MEWSTAYLGCFVLGLTFVALSALVGKFGGDADGGGHDAGGHDLANGEISDGGSAGKVGLPLFSPTVLAVFIGMFGAGGLLLHRVLGIESVLLHAGGASAISAVTGLSVAWTMMKLLTHAETNAMASHREVVGQNAEVVAAIRGQHLGQIAYTAGGTYQTMVARAEAGVSFAQGVRVRVLSISEGVASVGPAGEGPVVADALPAESTGVPVEKERVK